MRLLSKVMTGVSVAALAVLVAGGVNVSAADVTTSKTISGIVAGDMVSFDAVKVKNNAPTYNVKAKWDLYEKAATVDLSNLKTTKDSYITVKTSSGTAIYKVNKDTQKKFKATCDGETIKLEVDGKAVEGNDLAKYSWRTENSAWTAFSTTPIDLTPYTMQGATLYIRYTGAGIGASIAEGTEKVKIDEKTEVKVKNIPANYFPAKEFKVKVPKKANAPVINVDYAKGEIKKNAKAVIKTGANVSGTLNVAFGTSVMAENFKINNSTAGVLMMQIPADTSKKKPASKTAVFEWPQTTAPTVTYTKPAISGTTISNQTSDLISGKLSYKAVDNANKAKATFEITSKDSDNTYEIYKGTESNGQVTYESKAIATLKKGSTKPVVLNASKAPEGTKLYIRIAGDKATAKLPSPFATTAVEPVYLETPKAAS